jgi:phosphonate transport system ATP-binding protein
VKNNILRIKNLSKTFDNGFAALKNFSFDVKVGEFLVVIGLSGSGKSTLLRCIKGLIKPSTGAIEFGGDPKSQIAMIFQHFNLVERHTVLVNVLTGALNRTPTLRSLLGMFAVEDVTRAKRYLELVGLSDRASHRVSQLSGGQKQRVAIARALMQNPKVLLADEPVSSLDPSTAHTILDYLKKINKEEGITIVCNLHFLSLVRTYADRVVALKAGEVVFEGEAKNINDEWFEKIYGEKPHDANRF